MVSEHINNFIMQLIEKQKKVRLNGKELSVCQIGI